MSVSPGRSWREAFELSGSSFFTLGFVLPPNDLPSFVVSFLEAATGLALLALLITARIAPRRRAGPVLLACVAGFGVSMIVFGLSTSFWLSLAALFMSGFTDGVSVVIRSVILRVETPEAVISIGSQAEFQSSLDRALADVEATYVALDLDVLDPSEVDLHAALGTTKRALNEVACKDLCPGSKALDSINARLR